MTKVSRSSMVDIQTKSWCKDYVESKSPSDKILEDLGECHEDKWMIILKMGKYQVTG